MLCNWLAGEQRSWLKSFFGNLPRRSLPSGGRRDCGGAGSEESHTCTRGSSAVDIPLRRQEQAFRGGRDVDDARKVSYDIVTSVLSFASMRVNSALRRPFAPWIVYVYTGARSAL